jgi:hypothetical protein
MLLLFNLYSLHIHGCVVINKHSVLVSLLALPLLRASLEFSQLHLLEAFLEAVIPLEDFFHAGRLLFIFKLATAIVRLEFGYYIGVEIETNLH